MPKPFPLIKEQLMSIGGELKPYHILALKQLGSNGAEIYDRVLAEALREIEKISPDLISITKPDYNSPSYGKRPYFICFRTSLGESFYKML